MALLNNRNPEDYYTQRNNEILPFETCNVTAVINALAATGWMPEQHERGFNKQPEDDLLSFMLQDEACKLAYAKIDPVQAYPMNQWISLLDLGARRWMDDNTICQYHENLHWTKLLTAISLGSAAVVSGLFPMQTARGVENHGHVVSVIDADVEASTGGINCWQLNDPYGDYRTNYVSSAGAHIPMSHADFIKILIQSQSDSKVAVVFRRKL